MAVAAIAAAEALVPGSAGVGGKTVGGRGARLLMVSSSHLPFTVLSFSLNSLYIVSSFASVDTRDGEGDRKSEREREQERQRDIEREREREYTTISAASMYWPIKLDMAFVKLDRLCENGRKLSRFQMDVLKGANKSVR